MGKLIGNHLPCPVCQSTDAFSIFEDDKTGKRNGYCFSCEAYVHNVSEDLENGNLPPQPNRGSAYRSKHTDRSKGDIRVSSKDPQEILTYPIRELSDRGINLTVAERYQVRVAVSTIDGVTPTSHFYPIFKDNTLVDFKERVVNGKQFFFNVGTKNPQLFGQQVAKPGSGTLYITEGECDAMALYQILITHTNLKDWQPSVVSIVTGATSAAKDIINNFDFVDSFEKVVICFDQDEAGKKATQDVCKLLAGKVYTAKLPCKDPNEALLKGLGKDLYWAVIKPQKYQPDGIVNGSDTWELFRHRSNSSGFAYPYEPLQKATLGAHEGQIITITSGTGSGKTTFMNELKYHFFNSTDHKIADITLENSLGETVSDLLTIHLSQPLKFPHVLESIPEDTLKSAHDRLFSTGRWEFYDHVGGLDDESLFSKLRYFAATGCKFIFLDHLSIIISEFADEGDERRRIDAIMTKLKKFAKEWSVIVFLVVHLRKPSDSRNSFEQGYMPTLDDLRGSASIKQLSDTLFATARNQQHPNDYIRNTSKFAILKNRFTGETSGELMYLNFNKNTGRMVCVPKPMELNQDE